MQQRLRCFPAGLLAQPFYGWVTSSHQNPKPALAGLLISEWIGQVKGASSHYVNHQLANRKILDWQTGYGVVSFGTKDLEWVVNYIRNQKEHHKKGTTIDRLEKITHDEEDES